jgi:hypothetical protein
MSTSPHSAPTDLGHQLLLCQQAQDHSFIAAVCVLFAVVFLVFLYAIGGDDAAKR